MSLTEVARRIFIEPAFANEIKADPENAISRAGLSLTKEEMKAINLFIDENPKELLSDSLNGPILIGESWITIN
jgi:hypothetical protein